MEAPMATVDVHPWGHEPRCAWGGGGDPNGVGCVSTSRRALREHYRRRHRGRPYQSRVPHSDCGRGRWDHGGDCPGVRVGPERGGAV